MATVLSLRELGGSGTISELDGAVIERIGFDENQQSIWMPDRRNLKINYRLAWARTWLKGAGIVNNSSRGVWVVTELGQTVDQDEVASRVTSWRDATRELRRKVDDQSIEPDDAESVEKSGETQDFSEWKSQLIEIIVGLQPDGFERLCQRLLQEAGFRDTKVVGRTGDKGIDIVGTYGLSLISFQTFVQCKKNSIDNHVGSPDMRNFRGSMRRFGDKGIFITTSRFSQSARDEAKRDGLESIELIDGDHLCELLKKYDLGLAVEQVERVIVIPEFFNQF